MEENPYEIAKQHIEIFARKAGIDNAMVEWLKKPVGELTVNFPLKKVAEALEIRGVYP